MKTKISVHFIDEAAHTSEVEALTSVADAVRSMHEERMHVLLNGYHRLLSPVYHSVWDMNYLLSK